MYTNELTGEIPTFYGSQNYHEPSAFIFGASLRETTNYWMSYSKIGNRFWSSTSQGTMNSWLKNFLNFDVSEFSYGYEVTMDGITNEDMSTLQNHINSGFSEVLMVDYNQFVSGKGDGSGAFYGDHFVVLDGEFNYSEKDDTVTFSYYDNHAEGNKSTKTMSTNSFKDMINSVLMLKKKE